MKEWIKLIAEADEPKKKPKTKTDTKPDTKPEIDPSLDRALNQPDPNSFPATGTPGGDEGPKEPPKSRLKLKTASPEQTRRAMSDIQFPQHALRSLANMDTSKIPKAKRPTKSPTKRYDVVVPETLPKVINTHLRAAGIVEPEWHLVSSLPRYVIEYVYNLGYHLFQSQTTTPLGEIQVLADFAGNNDKEIQAVAAYLEKNSKLLSKGEIDLSEVFFFDEYVYKPEFALFTIDGIRFMMVLDNWVHIEEVKPGKATKKVKPKNDPDLKFGRYIYAWPEQDSVKPQESGSEEPEKLGPEVKKLKHIPETLRHEDMKKKSTLKNQINIKNLIEEFEGELEYYLMESEQKIQFLSKQFADKLKIALKSDGSQPAKKLEQIIKNMNNEAEASAEPIVRAITQADPAGERHDALQWLVRMYIAGQYKLEDLDRTRDKVEKFYKYRPKLANKDLNSYKTFRDFYDIINKAEADFGAEVKTKGEEFREIVREGINVIYSEPGFEAQHILTKEAGIAQYGWTDWCWASRTNNKFDYYNRQGKIYVVKFKGPGGKSENRYISIHFESDQAKDEEDLEIRSQPGKPLIKFLSEYPGWAKFLNMLIGNHYESYFSDSA